MALDKETETVTCDTENCDRKATLAVSVPKGWYFTVEVENHIGTYTDYCPEHANGRKHTNSDPQKENN